MLQLADDSPLRMIRSNVPKHPEVAAECRSFPPLLARLHDLNT
jgi:hypothetical protein